MKPISRIFIALASAATLTATPLAQAQQPSPKEKAYKFRTSLFQTYAWKLGQMAGAKSQGNEATFIQHAKDLAYLSGLVEEGFTIENNIPEGSKAKPEIWQDYEKFQEKGAILRDLANEYSNAGTMADFNPREFGSKACGSCHRDFKIKD